METKIINSLSDFFEALQASGKTVIAPVRQPSGKIFFQPVKSYSEIATDFIQTTFSAKSVAFPKVEVLFSYHRTEDGMELQDTLHEIPETVVWGLRPCDASAFDYLTEFFLRENPDVYFRRRKEWTTLVSIACSQCDDSCFCTSVGSHPGDTTGSDILLTLMENSYYAEILTEKGTEAIALAPNLFQDSPVLDKTPFLAQPATKFSLEEIGDRIRNAYDKVEWKQASLGCYGCGACAFSCPTCSCFDIQDEGTREAGKRLRCWDACGLSQFTLHASGHNPRTNQTERRRQRLLHKFQYSVENLGIVSCVGCGRCIRVCPSHLNIFENILSVTQSHD